jgi:hypothetical protein
MQVGNFEGRLERKVNHQSTVSRVAIVDRAFYMNIAMNAVAKEGYEFAGMTSDEIVMRRAIAR